MNKLLLAAACGLLLISACNNSQKDYQRTAADPIMYSQLVHELNTVVMGNNFSPIVASRNYMYASVAAYEVMAKGYPAQYNSLAGQLNQLGPVPEPDTSAGISFDFAAMLAFSKVGEAVTFPAGSMKEYMDSLKGIMREAGMSSAILKSSEAYADLVAKHIIEWSKGDNYAQTRSAPKFTVVDTPGRWVPTPPAYFSAAEPHWAEIRPIVLEKADQFIPPPPIPFNMTDKNSAYYKEVMKLKLAGDSLTEEQKHIANFWDDNPLKMNVSGHVMFSTKKFSPPGTGCRLPELQPKRPVSICHQLSMLMLLCRLLSSTRLFIAGMKNTATTRCDLKQSSIVISMHNGLPCCKRHRFPNTPVGTLPYRLPMPRR